MIVRGLTQRKRFKIEPALSFVPEARDIGAGDLGNWETSGIIDVTSLFPTTAGNTLLFANVQAHGIRDGIIGGNGLLAQGRSARVHRRAGSPPRPGLPQPQRDDGEHRLRVHQRHAGNSYFFALTATNPGAAPNGGFFGIDITLGELMGELTPPLLGTLDSEGEASFSFPLLAQCPIGVTVDCVAIEFAGLGGPVRASRAITIDF